MPIFKINEDGTQSLINVTESMIVTHKVFLEVEFVIPADKKTNPNNLKIQIMPSKTAGNHSARIKISKGRNKSYMSIPINRNEEKTTLEELESNSIVVGNRDKDLDEDLARMVMGFYLYDHKKISGYVFKGDHDDKDYENKINEKLEKEMSDFIRKLDGKYTYANINSVIEEKRKKES